MTTYAEQAEQAREEFQKRLENCDFSFYDFLQLHVKCVKALDTLARVEAVANARVRADRLTMQSDYSLGHSDGKFEALESVLKALEGE